MNNIANVLTHTCSQNILTYTFSQKEYIITAIISALLTILCTFLMKKGEIDEEDEYYSKVQGISETVAIFCFYKGVLKLTLPNWWVLLSGIILTLVNFVPGGYTIMNLIFKHFNMITLPTWALILGIFVDIYEIISLDIPLIKYLKRELKK